MFYVHKKIHYKKYTISCCFHLSMMYRFFQFVKNLMGLSDLLQGCYNKTDTVMISQYCYSLVLSTV